MASSISGSLAAALRAKDLSVSQCDGRNHCTVEAVELDSKEVLLSLEVVGDRYDASSSEIFTFLSTAQWQASGALREEERTISGSTKVRLSFPAPAAAYFKDLYFCYAPGYSHVSISDYFVADEMAYPPQARNNSDLFRSGYAGSQCLDVQYPGTFCNEDLASLQQRQPPKQEVADTLACDWAARGDTICAAVEAKHHRVMCVMTNRLHSLQAFQASWEAGDTVALVKKLEACSDDALPAAFLGRFSEHREEIHPTLLTRLLPLAQKLVQAKCEEHAVAAVRFALHLLNVSWPGVAKALKSVATPRVLFRACEEVVQQLQSMFSVVKALSRSVKISKTNGPLAPLCKKLKANLEEALAAVGRLRS